MGVVDLPILGLLINRRRRQSGAQPIRDLGNPEKGSGA